MQEFFLSAVENIPGICIGTDLLAGFPEESEEDFAETCETFLSLPFSYCHVFTYSERNGTYAKKSFEQLPIRERRKRSAELRNLSGLKRMNW